jgi:hypothetical protein
MSSVFMHSAVSVDGFLADPYDEVGPLFDWYFNGDTEIVDGARAKELAGDRMVVIAAGDVGGRALASCTFVTGSATEIGRL